ncbi:DUF7504 family protein [Haladaptatus halobius]|uniref:DUF7504 family protein n=1 Tax=Haladaptatus halobius TaxID=2884875 RepID=UPI001D09D48D|nr:hypothetical protein [Haladaptatus halobius]
MKREETKFRKLLEKYKEEGCNLLVTGKVSDTSRAQLIENILGTNKKDRKRILAFTHTSTQQIESYLPPGISMEDPDVWVIDQVNNHRSIPAAAAETGVSSSNDSSSSLEQLQNEVITAISFFDYSEGGLNPAQLRFSIDSISGLFDANKYRVVMQFLHAVTAMVRGVHGMGWYHLPVEDDSQMVNEILPIFDARIELRQQSSLVPDQRWHFPDHDLTTEWVRL